MSKVKRKPKSLTSKQLKSVPLTAYGFGLSQGELDTLAKDMETRFEKMGCCERAALSLGLMMAGHNLTLENVVKVQEYANHLITVEKDADGKVQYSVSKALINIMAKQTPVQ